MATLSDGGIFAALFEPVGDGPGREAVGAEDYSGDALGDLRFGERVGVEAFFGVIVDVDEAGGEDQVGAVDDLVGWRWV